jgi:hypothetical protein
MGLTIKRVTARIMGGLGNQLFCYAAARRLALKNGAELRIDHLSGFENDPFERSYILGNYNIAQNLVVPNERFISFGRYQRGLVTRASKLIPYSIRPYLVDQGGDFDQRLVHLNLRRNVYLDGYWQSSLYFEDIDSQIRDDLKLKVTLSPSILEIAHRIRSVNAVAIHARRTKISHPLGISYYKMAIDYLKKYVNNPHFFIFSDSTEWAQENLSFCNPHTFVTVGQRDQTGCTDFELMRCCKHFIISNSTFSWWGAWLSLNPGKIVICPAPFENYGHFGYHPSNWTQIGETSA